MLRWPGAGRAATGIARRTSSASARRRSHSTESVAKTRRRSYPETVGEAANPSATICVANANRPARRRRSAARSSSRSSCQVPNVVFRPRSNHANASSTRLSSASTGRDPVESVGARKILRQNVYQLVGAALRGQLFLQVPDGERGRPAIVGVVIVGVVTVEVVIVEVVGIIP